jgi:hypothetical protein
MVILIHKNRVEVLTTETQKADLQQKIDEHQEICREKTPLLFELTVHLWNEKIYPTSDSRFRVEWMRRRQSIRMRFEQKTSKNDRVATWIPQKKEHQRDID